MTGCLLCELSDSELVDRLVARGADRGSAAAVVEAREENHDALVEMLGLA